MTEPMATCAVETTSKHRGHKHTYQPAATLAYVQGVRERQDYAHDCYSGTKAQLIEMGLAPDGKFPGDPSMPHGAVELWPEEAPRGCGFFYPGKLKIVRLPSGKFTASLSVSREEKEKREGEELARREADRVAREAAHAKWQAASAVEAKQQAPQVAARRQQSHLRLVWSAPHA